MTSRAARRETVRIEAIASAILGLIMIVSIAAGGIGGFAQVLASLVFFGIAVVVVAGTCFLVMRSRLILPKRAGVSLIIVSGFTGWLWHALQPPPMWGEVRATIRSVVSPPCRTDSDYSFQVKGVTQTFALGKEWPSVDEAHRDSNAGITVYFNPSRPAEVSEKPMSGWIRVTASPHATRYQPLGEYRATIAYGEGIFAMSTATITGAAANNKIGATIPLWMNPLNPKELSLTPRPTIGGKRYVMLSLAIAGAIAGIVLLFTERRWIAVAQTETSQSTTDARSSPSSFVQPPTMREQLDRIDWYQFEKVCARILERTGSTVERSGGANPDGGADIIARRDGRTAVVQCKFWKRTLVTPKILRELLGTKASAGFAASDAILFSLSDCTEEAKRFAAENGIGIYEAAYIAKIIDDLGVEHFPELAEPNRKFCPRCDAHMILREAATPFWGCSNFPTRGCRGKIETS